MDNGVVKYILGASRVKFDILDSLIRKVPSGKYRMCVLHVDAHAILYRLYQEKDMARIYEDTMGDLVRDIVVGFFNVIGHYRRYLATRLHMDNDIFVYFNRELPAYHKKKYPKFNQKLYQKYDTSNPEFGFTSKAIQKAYEFICGLSPYFEGIYCLDNNGIDDCSLAARFGFSEDNLYIIISRNLYWSQLIRENVVQLYPSRDRSRMLTLDTCFSEGVLHKRRTAARPEILPSMLPLLWTFTDCKSVGVEQGSDCYGSMTAMIKIVNRFASVNWLHPNLSLDQLIDMLQLKPVNLQELRDRYAVLNATITSNAITSDQYLRMMSMCYDLFDQTGLEELNEQLVSSNMIDPQILEIDNLNMSTGAPMYDGSIEEDWHA